MNKGWICPKCQQSVAPTEKHCDCDEGGVKEMSLLEMFKEATRQPYGDWCLHPDCGCPPGKVCGGTGCPRAVQISYTVPDGWSTTTGAS